ncbi:MAG: hypothetical protein D6760_01910 [Deltaproteobacteria bacterium]|nr:MAG: hypothetical protein D6760_01910 [Deltaproteobacteria bacterium]
MKIAKRQYAACATALILGALIVGCSRGDSKKNTAAEDSAPVIEKIEGMRYYVGGPVMKADKYGRLRLGGFNGQVTTPSSRGLLIGYKPNDDGTFEYRTWVNGRPVQKSVGFRDEDGLLWFTKRETYDGQGRVIARQTLTYDNDREVMNSTYEQVDPETGKVLKSVSREVPYAPPSEKEDEEGEDEGGE